jgi:hypothetical protein
MRNVSKPPPTARDNLCRFVSDESSIRPLGRVIRIVDHTTPEDRANYEKAQQLIEEARKAK